VALSIAIISGFFLLRAASGQTAPSAGTRAADEEDIREVVIRKQMEDWYRSGDKSVATAKDKTEKEVAEHLNFKIFFVSVSGKDPSDEFIRRLRDIPRTIKKASHCRVIKEGGAVADRNTGQFGIVFRADAIRWSGKDSVQVEGGYHCGGRCGAGITYELQREQSKWIVKSARMNWIS
jgi:archaellum component FlaF (FlaF/FlaG flagellin family)